MAIKALVAPLSADEPCGPDHIGAQEAAAFADYFEATSKLPRQYFDLARGAVFSLRGTERKELTDRIDRQLARSRDLRLFALRAKAAALALDLADFAETLDTIAHWLEAHPAALHPRVDGGSEARRDALAELDSMPHVVMPLEMIPLAEAPGGGTATLRAYAVGRGERPPRAGEDKGDPGAVTALLSRADVAPAVEATLKRLETVQQALGRITVACMAPDGGGFNPPLDRLAKRVEEMAALVRLARRDLDGSAAPDPAASAIAAQAPGPAPAAPPPPAQGIADHAEARRILRAVEAYFVAREPAALALVLVTQARRLVGRPLVEALTTLLGDNARYVRIAFGEADGFTIPIERMQELSDALLPAGEEAEAPPPDPLPSREAALAAMQRVEAFFRAVEPASPIPILLFKARASVGKAFDELLSDLIPRDE